MKRTKNGNPAGSDVYLVGSGIASLASAVYLIQDVGMPGSNIHILEQVLGLNFDSVTYTQLFKQLLILNKK